MVSKKKKLIYGVGDMGSGKYVSSIDNKRTPEYEKWFGMMRRCYSEKAHQRKQSYRLSKVTQEWHCFQSFAEWLTDQKFYNHGYDLDKDLLSIDSKIYSPDTCVLIPRDINKIIAIGSPARSLPRGVHICKKKGVFIAQIKIENKTKCLGNFTCADTAHIAYKEAKENYVKEIAEIWRDKIDDRVYQALMGWQVK